MTTDKNNFCFGGQRARRFKNAASEASAAVDENASFTSPSTTGEVDPNTNANESMIPAPEA